MTVNKHVSKPLQLICKNEKKYSTLMNDHQLLELFYYRNKGYRYANFDKHCSKQISFL